MDIRSEICQLLLREVGDHLATQNPIRVAVIGGGQDEPELITLSEKFNLNPYFFGIETLESSNFSYLDLNMEEPASIEHLGQYDLILCSQVLEHLWNVPQAFIHFKSLLRNGGMAWIACPYSNIYHGSPYFYSAGYSPELIVKLAENQTMQVVQVGFKGTKRLYRSRHLLAHWFSDRQLRYPLISYFGVSGSYLEKILYNLKILPERLILTFSSNTQSRSEFDAVETWALIKKV